MYSICETNHCHYLCFTRLACDCYKHYKIENYDATANNVFIVCNSIMHNVTNVVLAHVDIFANNGETRGTGQCTHAETGAIIAMFYEGGLLLTLLIRNVFCWRSNVFCFTNGHYA